MTAAETPRTDERAGVGEGERARLLMVLDAAVVSNRLTLEEAIAFFGSQDRLAAAEARAERAEAERDEAECAVTTMLATVDAWQADLDGGHIRDPGARYCWGLAAREARAALLDGDRPTATDPAERCASAAESDAGCEVEESRTDGNLGRERGDEE